MMQLFAADRSQIDLIEM